MKKLRQSPGTESIESRRPSSFRIPYVRFRPLPVVLTLVTIALMISLGNHIIERFRATQLLAYTHVAEIYVSRFLAPYAQTLSRGESPDPDRAAEIAALLDPTLRRGYRIAMHIWSVEGQLLYSSLPSADMTMHDDADLLLAITGKDTAKLEETTPDDDGAPLPPPYLEIYLPIRASVDDPVIAIGEIYLDATAILSDIRRFERTVILATGLATFAVLMMLAASARQSEQLRERLEAERQLSIQNATLRRLADQARLDASRANEETLNLVGAELHDGPVQLLSLAALMPPPPSVGTAEPGMSQSTLIRQAVDQLRELSSGLILPEIEPLDLNAIVKLAADRFRALTATPLRVTFPKTDVAIDLPRRICLYRVIQEGLTNANRHGDGGEVRLNVQLRANVLNIVILSRTGSSALPAGRGPTHQLGLQAMRRRLAVFHGTAVLRDVGTATALQVALPISQDETGERNPGDQTSVS
jgi:signal transduction histidine kinase